MLSRFFPTIRCLFLPAAFVCVGQYGLSQPCPTLNANATLTSPDCAPGLAPCTVCPGDVVTLTASGKNLQPGVCVNWYYGVANNFNPYNGQGTLLGCSKIQAKPPSSCAQCPLTLALFADACGTEENNEIIAILSGSGFYVDDLNVDFDPLSTSGSGNASIGTGCSWQEPDPNAVASIQTICPGAVVVGAGPGEAVPAGVPVIIFTSAGYDFNYNFGSLCPFSPTIYVMQNSCVRTADAFDNAGSGGSRTTTVSLSCGCSDNTTYNTGSLVGGNGAFVTDAGFPPFYGNAGCGFPGLPGGGGGGGSSPIEIPPFSFTVTPDMCNGGPYWVVGVIEPLPAGCSQTFTNYMGFNVPCPMPVLTSTDLCEKNGPYDLTQLEDPTVPDGVWSGPGVTGNNFDPDGLTGPVTLTFTPTGACGIPATATINVSPNPTAAFGPVPPVCKGQTIRLPVTFTGQAPWSFDLFGNGSLVNNLVLVGNPDTIFVKPVVTTNYVIQNLQDGLFCPGGNASVLAVVSPGGSATLSLTGSDTICNGQSTTFSVDFNGNAPYGFIYSINGVRQPEITTSADPYVLSISPSATAIVKLDSLTTDAGTCVGTFSGTDTVVVTPGPVGVLAGDSTNLCDGASDTLRFSFSGPKTYMFTYALNGVNQTAVTTSDSVYKIPIVPATGLNVFKLVSIKDSLGCIGTVSGADTLVVNALPAVTLSGDTTICPGEPAPLRFDFSGPGPYTLQYTANGLPLSSVSTPSNPFITTVTPASATNYAPTSVSSNGCTGTVSGQALVNLAPALSATISGGGQICQNGSGTNISVSFVGSGPYTFHYKANNTVIGPITTSANPYTLAVNPPNGTFYTLVDVSNGICSGTVSGVAIVAVFTPSTALLSGDKTFCDSANTTVMVDFTGTGPFSLVYKKDNVIQPLVETFDDPYFIPVNTTTTTTYTLVSIESPGCTGTANGSATITINYKPTYSNVFVTCNPVTSSYTVEFDVIGATLPLTLVTGSGNFTGTHFTSAAIPLASGFSFSFHDAKNCGNVVVSGPSTCTCLTQVGAMDPTPITRCVGETATALYDKMEQLDPNDTLRYILHTNPALPIGTILAWSNTPNFTFGNGMTPGVTYYISAIAGNNQTATLTIDLNDPCLSVAQGTPVTFLPQPSATLGMDTSICSGTTYNLEVSLTGTPPLSFIYAVDGVSQPAVTNINAATYSLALQPTDTTVITLLSVSDLNCTSNIADTVNIQVIFPPLVTNDTTKCDFVTDTYIVEFDVSGPAPHAVTGLTGTFMGNHFTSDPIPIVTPYAAQVSDANACGQTAVAGTANCGCETNAGTMNQTPLEFCANTNAVGVHNGDQILDNDDVFQYILHTTADSTLGTVLATGNTPSFAFIPGTTVPGTTYYISAIAGTNDGSGNVSLADACRSIAPGAPVLWNALPTAMLSGNFDICPGQTQPLLVTFTGEAPYSLTYTNNAQTNTSPTINQNFFTIGATLIQSATFTLVSVSDANCPGVASGQAVITVHPKPATTPVKVNCATDGLSYTLEFTVTKGDLATVTVTGAPTGTYNPVTGVFTSDPVPSTQKNYNFTINDSWNCGQVTLSGQAGCPCVTDAGSLSSTPLVLCSDQQATLAPASGVFLQPDDSLYYLLMTTTSVFSGTILNSAKSPSFGFIPGTMTPNTPYYIVAIAGNSAPGGVWLGDSCLSVSNVTPVSWRAPVSAALSGNSSICSGETATLNLQLAGGAPYTVVYAIDNVAQAPITVNADVFGLQVTPTAPTTTYSLVSVSSSGCTGTVSGTATVTLRPVPTAAISGDTLLCIGGSTTFEVNFTGTAPYKLVYAINGNAQPILSATQNTFTISTNNVQQTQVFTLISVEDAFCKGTVSGSATVNVQLPPTVGLSGNSSICPGLSATLSVQLQNAATCDLVITGGPAPLTFTGVSDGFTFNVTPAQTTTYTITSFTPANNKCTPVITTAVTVTVTTLLATTAISDFNGFGVSCSNASDGSIVVTPNGGTGPYSVIWDNNSTGTPLDNLPAGDYSYTVTDANGCSTTGQASISEPEPLEIVLTALNPSCLDETGAVLVEDIINGNGPYDIQVGSVSATQTLPALIPNLPPGEYPVTVSDANGCTAGTLATINPPQPISVDLGPDITVAFGDQATLEAVPSTTAIDTLVWTPNTGLLNPKALVTRVIPLQTITYEIWVSDTAGCTARDEIRVVVEKLGRVYIPNAIKPDSENLNGALTVFAGPEVRQVHYLRVYDRWGDCVYENRNFLPNDLSIGWNGQWRDKEASQGVYVYVAEVEYLDGTTEIFSGDVTLAR